ncbi:MAG: threonylcarbamoyl-AMP synthase [Clostridiales bacterium]|nr:threonylcarbamoyl-AMP synthase [Clostridiales bacterium]
MNTQVLPPTKEALELASELLRNGQLVAFPTETVYGLGANALDEAAVRGIFSAKGRPADNPLIVHVSDAASAEALCQLTPDARKLMAAFCPGPLTLLLPKKNCILPVVNAGLPSVAIRIPNHPVAQALLHASRLPIAAPSANVSGRPSPTTAAHVRYDLHGRIPLILDGGTCQVGLESTVLDMTTNPPNLLRPGGISPEMLLTVLPEVRVVDSVLRPMQEGEKPLSPGMMYRHYAPEAKLILVKGQPGHVCNRCEALYREATEQGVSVRILVFEEHLPLYGEHPHLVPLGSLGNLEAVAQLLFSLLRQMDEDGAQLLLCEVPEPKGIGLAILNRLCRAASFCMEDADQ